MWGGLVRQSTWAEYLRNLNREWWTPCARKRRSRQRKPDRAKENRTSIKCGRPRSNWQRNLDPEGGSDCCKAVPPTEKLMIILTSRETTARTCGYLATIQGSTPLTPPLTPSDADRTVVNNWYQSQAVILTKPDLSSNQQIMIGQLQRMETTFLMINRTMGNMDKKLQVMIIEYQLMTELLEEFFGKKRANVAVPENRDTPEFLDGENKDYEDKADNEVKDVDAFIENVGKDVGVIPPAYFPKDVWLEKPPLFFPSDAVEESVIGSVPANSQPSITVEAFMEDDIIRAIEDYPTAKEMFDAITLEYNTTTTMHVQLLLEQYNSYKMKESDRVVDHVNEMLVMAKDLGLSRSGKRDFRQHAVLYDLE
ncbi:hypothetical protein EJ110_NYTH14678 [Nymphaea thermarum]|nr:hypothetical protein EJ110_NYTH14678 [Nymphaea thermarum]